MYFVDPITGFYNFDASKLKHAHEWCQISTIGYMSNSEPKIIVSNTFTQEWEMDAYYKMAERFGYRVYSIIVENRHGGENSHRVPEDVLLKMKERFEIKLC